MKKQQEKQDRITTKKLAIRFGVEPSSIRRSLCVKGHYLGIIPIKLPNGRLLWPDRTPEQVV